MATELATVVSDYDAKLNEAWEHMHALEDDFKKLTGRPFGRHVVHAYLRLVFTRCLCRPRGRGGLATRGRGPLNSFHRRPVLPPVEEAHYGPMEQPSNDWAENRRNRHPMSTRAGFRPRSSWNTRREEYVEYPPPLGKRRLEETERPYGPAPPSPEDRHYQRESSWKEVPEANMEWREEWSRDRPTVTGPRPRRMDYEEPMRRGFMSSRNELRVYFRQVAFQTFVFSRERPVGYYGRGEIKYGQRRFNRPFGEETKRPIRRRDSPPRRIVNQGDDKTEQEEPSVKIQRRSKISPITFSDVSPPRDNSSLGAVRSHASPQHRRERQAAAKAAAVRSKAPKSANERNRRFFGMMMNTLRTFDSEGPEGFEIQAKKIKEVGARLEAEREEERKKVAEEKQKIIEQRRQQRLEIRRLQRKRGIVMVHEAEICHMKRLQSFIVTVTQPQICYLPAKHTIRTMELHKKSQRVLEESIAKVREDMNAQLREIDAMDNVEVGEAEAEEEVHSPENENYFMDEEAQNVFEQIEVSEQFKTEITVEGDAELLDEGANYKDNVLTSALTEESIMTETHDYESDAYSDSEMETTIQNRTIIESDRTEMATFENNEIEMVGDAEMDREKKNA
ncbi:pinin:SDK:memA: protein region [Trichuris trichiura]|uniref:Pinin:SDK:memA: protein region n=1 Tax=Trichuris trichiura TaxID=36087 RepID=A0A077Z3B8_TRITR|nr:pinin:SDK:memA: protein region [Trichuris trichiura]